MNAADINAARRLIAQFEGKALGRHNSNQFNRRQDLQSAPEQNTHVCVKSDPQKCRVGDYCFNIGVRIPANQMIARVLKDMVGQLRTAYPESWTPTLAEFTTMEFERVRVHKADGQMTWAWHRIA